MVLGNYQPYCNATRALDVPLHYSEYVGMYMNVQSSQTYVEKIPTKAKVGNLPSQQPSI